MRSRRMRWWLGAAVLGVGAALGGRLTTRDVVGLNRALELFGLAPREAALRWWEEG